MASELDDDHLIDEALAGRPEAFGQLAARYQDRLFHAMTHISGSQDDARDVVQDALVQAFLKLEDFHRASAFYTWLYRIAFNVAAGRWRKVKNLHSLDGAAAKSVVIDQSARPGTSLEQQETVLQVQAALQALAEEYRTVLVMREMDGCDYETIAIALDLPVGTVRSRLHRARTQMRELLKEVLELEKD